MCRVIRMADVVGAAREFSNSFRSYENWDGASSLDVDRMIEATGAALPEELTAADNEATGSVTAPSVSSSCSSSPVVRKSKKLKGGVSFRSGS